MKKILLIITLCLFAKSFAQLDTLNYLKQFEINKTSYIGKPFSKLLNDMKQIQTKAVWPVPNFRTKYYNFSTDFNFCDKEASFHNVITLSIEWEDPILRSNTRYFQELNNALFTNEEKNFYGSKIIKDIKVYR
ncbi:hypothetical protein DBR39_03640 [Chryseobacterium sp. KBW03]|uniref:hypothetical protein n=1 Tax=Chryseobacterium sp. KBW03 TaxID=2153362 RepID=UPI000F59427D|nr:hypothetical protein [Chryseobacterium sp. KBW03]RQO41717.1 hypothetical protein DBR39_03640 [Chryseobacterium sp. KBW03]